MAIADADIAFAVDLFSDLGGITTRKMFGGMCLYKDGTVFALMTSEGILHLKCRDDLAAELADSGATQFHNMPYWSFPESALDDPTEACALASRALAHLQ